MCIEALFQCGSDLRSPFYDRAGNLICADLLYLEPAARHLPFVGVRDFAMAPRRQGRPMTGPVSDRSGKAIPCACPQPAGRFLTRTCQIL